MRIIAIGAIRRRLEQAQSHYELLRHPAPLLPAPLLDGGLTNDGS